MFIFYIKYKIDIADITTECFFIRTLKYDYLFHFGLKCFRFGVEFWLTSNRIFGLCSCITRPVQDSNMHNNTGLPQKHVSKKQYLQVGFIFFVKHYL